MSRLAGVFLLLCLHAAGLAYGMDCTLGTSKNFLEKAINSCPRAWESRDKSYCCYDVNDETAYCCNVEDFIVKSGLGIVVPVIIAAAVVISLIVCCISCFCCSCCPWYRRRHQGTVYGKVQAPSIVQVVQSQAIPPSYSNQAQAQNQYIPYPVNPTEYPPQQPPPQYTSEAYAKQAPYNPTYPPQ